MNCEEATKLMDGYLDGELDPVTSQKIEQHLRDCRKCEQAYEAHTALIQAISRGAPYYKARAELREHSIISARTDRRTAGAQFPSGDSRDPRRKGSGRPLMLDQAERVDRW